METDLMNIFKMTKEELDSENKTVELQLHNAVMNKEIPLSIYLLASKWASIAFCRGTNLMIILSILIMFSGCENSVGSGNTYTEYNTNKFLGAWEDSLNNIYYEFKENGVCVSNNFSPCYYIYDNDWILMHNKRIKKHDSAYLIRNDSLYIVNTFIVLKRAKKWM